MRAACLALVPILLLTGPAWAAGAHQHGVARLELAVDGPALTLTLDSPLDNLVGFERGPRNAAERAKVQAMATTLRGAGTLFQPTPAAGCSLKDVALASDVIDPALLAPAAAPAATAPAQVPAAGGHADLEATWTFDCRTPAALKGVALGGLFQAFPRLKQLDTAVAVPGVQRGFKLGPARPQITW